MADETLEMPAVIVEGGPIDGHSMPLAPGTSLIVGSGRLAHLRLDHPMIELAHVKVAWDDLGIAMVDNGSRHGTWVNGEKVESAALLDGDVITFTPPDTQPPAPRVRLRIPKGSVPDPPPPPPEAEATAAPGAAGPARVAGRTAARPRHARRARSAFAFDMPEPRTLAFVGGGLALVVVLGWLGARLLSGGGVPSLSTVQPARCEAGSSITLIGSGFGTNAAEHKVWFGERSVAADSVGGGTLHVSVPAGVGPGQVPIVVENPAGRSNAVTLVVLPPVQAAALEPAGAVPGDSVLLRGGGFEGDEVSVAVGGVPARVLEAGPEGLRFEMPAVEGARGSMHDVVATVGGRAADPLRIALGRLPLVLSFDPPRASAGGLVRLQGLGFPEDAGTVSVTFDARSALVVSSSGRELVVVAPPPVGSAAETQARVEVRVGERASADDLRYPLVRLTVGTYVLRFFAAAGEGSAPATATVATEIAPVLMLGGRTQAEVASRAVRAAAALNEQLDRRRSGALVLAAQAEPEAGVAVEGASAVLVATTAADAGAYLAPRGLPSRGAPPTRAELAAWWAAVLNDYLAVCTGPDRPAAVAGLDPGSGAAFAELRRALPWRYRAGVSNEDVAGLSESLRARLREAAMKVP